MKKRTALAALAAIAAAVLVLPASSVGAQNGTDLYIVHGLNLGEADNTLVTVCVNGDELFQFSYGQVEEVPGQEGPLNVEVFLGANPDCEGEAAFGAPDFTPSGAAQAVVATFIEPGDPPVLGLQPFALNVDCTEGEGARLTALHASALVPPVFPGVDGAVLPDALEFGDELAVDLPAGTYEVGLFLEPEVPAVEPSPVNAPVATNTVLAAVGDPGNTLAVIEFPVPVGVCDGPDPEPTPDGPTPDGPTPDADAVTPVPAADRPLALTG